MIALIPPIATVLAFASDASDSSPADELWERLTEELPNPILEETLGLTSDVIETLGFLYASGFIQILAVKGDTERFQNWKVIYEELRPFMNCGDSVFDELAEREDLSADIYRILSHSSSVWVRQKLAKNKVVPFDVLELLAQDRVDVIRVAVAGNSSSPQKVLQFLAQDFFAPVRVKVAGNPSVSIEILEMMCKDWDELVSSAARRELQFLKEFGIR